MVFIPGEFIQNIENLISDNWIKAACCFIQDEQLGVVA